MVTRAKGIGHPQGASLDPINVVVKDVVPLTSNLAGRRFPINVLLTREDTGLKRDSLLLGGQIRTVAKERLLRKLSALRSERMSNVQTALKLYLGLME